MRLRRAFSASSSRMRVRFETVAPAYWRHLRAFVEVDAPSDDELHALLQSVITRLLKMLTRRGVLFTTRWFDRQDQSRSWRTWLASAPMLGFQGIE